MNSSNDGEVTEEVTHPAVYYCYAGRLLSLQQSWQNATYVQGRAAPNGTSVEISKEVGLD